MTRLYVRHSFGRPIFIYQVSHNRELNRASDSLGLTGPVKFTASFSFVSSFSFASAMASQPESSRVHPRRRQMTTAPPSFASSSRMVQDGSSRPSLSLRKGETFHSPTTPPSGDRDPVVSFRTLPTRSPTCPKSLEAIVAGEERMSDILNRIDLNSTSSSNAMPRPHDDMPVPRSFLQRQTSSNAVVRKADKHPMMDGPQRFSQAKVRHDHASDSGLGSSISSSQGMMSDTGKGISNTPTLYIWQC